MNSFAMLFPGQGSQYIGMLSSFFQNNNIITQTFNEASHYINDNLLKLVKEGPKIKLNQNKYTQVIILTASVSIYRLWKKKNGRLPSLMSGHSLGEYSALVCSGSIKFSDALKIVFLRGKLMEATTINRPGLMKAIIGIESKIVQSICKIMSSKKKIVAIASINSDNQTVISGDKNTVCKTSLICKNFGAKHIFNLNINIAAHCILMKPISKQLKKILHLSIIRSPNIPIINNVDVKIENTTKKIQSALIRQIYSTVRWKEIINLIQSKKIFIMLEIGPGKILTNLNKNNKKIISFDTNNLKNFLIAFKKINK
ncbi:ACP S-malonyltransferase [Buchnera aphidicola]|uniref:Malonyl CoA-acyl carrier protein transacylase n=1 Tax=Buchnera aphidicola (Lipaphis pseudobrassicae) TaxID=1258543 RepID=A0A4D6Y0N4_9GAMM|nr:ACP S-malonyltransferase [Buchnera aphidicola]QCI22209.1 [acyl-carrier-protein] S-malonyltransferase [Buchnera aphidicola (Lipaphis pseudobrassicae)]